MPANLELPLTNFLNITSGRSLFELGGFFRVLVALMNCYHKVWVCIEERQQPFAAESLPTLHYIGFRAFFMHCEHRMSM